MSVFKNHPLMWLYHGQICLFKFKMMLSIQRWIWGPSTIWREVTSWTHCWGWKAKDGKVSLSQHLMHCKVELREDLEFLDAIWSVIPMNSVVGFSDTVTVDSPWTRKKRRQDLTQSSLGKHQDCTFEYIRRLKASFYVQIGSLELGGFGATLLVVSMA